MNIKPLGAEVRDYRYGIKKKGMSCLPVFSFLSVLSVIYLATCFFHFLLPSTKY